MRFRARTALLILLVAAVASVFSTTVAYQTVRNDGRAPDTFVLAALNSSFWFGWVLLAWPLSALSARWRIDRTPRVAIPLHIVAVVTAGSLHVALQSTTQSALYVRSFLMKEGVDGSVTALFAKRWMTLFPMQLLQLIDWELLAGMGVVALAHAVFYYRETQQRALREANLETRLIEAQLTALQQQLQPHFLFNTLHAISALMHRDVNLADKVLVRLSDLLRITLDSGREREISLGREMEFIQKYLDIEKMRIGERLTVTTDIAPDTLDCVVPTLILQPLVENAIKHGIARHIELGTLAIQSSKRDGMLTLTVADNGPGPVTADMVRHGGIGLSNTRARLHHHFGDDGRLYLDRRPDGFTARLTFPCRK